MGNAAIRRIPEDLTQCTEAQLRVMINSVIINNPWNDDDNQSEEDSLLETIAIMREKGFRPITPAEYVKELTRQRKEKHATNQGIKVWLPIDANEASCTAESKQRRGSDSDSNGSKQDSPRFHSSCSYSSHESYAYNKSPGLSSLELPRSREDAASEVLKSGSSAAILSEMSEDDIVTEEWPTHGGHLQRSQAQRL
jgi:hypothetical protein